MSARIASCVLPIAVATAIATAARAQSWLTAGWSQVRTSVAFAHGAIAYDAGRDRVLVIDLRGDAYEHDGRRWTKLAPFPVPSQSRVAMAYDARRGRVIACVTPNAPMGRLGTLEYDGASWRPVGTATVPPSMRTRLAYDAARQVVVLFGVEPVTATAHTWELDAADWHRRLPAASPPANDNAALAFDPSRNVTVLFGGERNGTVQQDHWEWNGTTWTQRTPPLLPPSRTNAQLAWDPNRNRLVLYSGYPVATPPVISDPRIWEFDGAQWTPRTIPNAPPGRSGHGMVQVSNGIVVVGGRATLGTDTDVWHYDGSRFVSLLPPEPGAEILAASDPARGRTVVLGLPFAGPPAATWEWDGQTLARMAVGAPSHRPGARLVAHPFAGVLRFGGVDPATRSYTGELWHYAGTSWQQLAVSGPSPARLGFAIATDPVRGRVVLFGGVDGNTVFLQDTWEFDGAGWSPVASTGPAPRSSAAMSFAADLGVCVLAGGQDPTQFLEDTWTWDGVQWQPTGATLPFSLSQGAARSAWSPGLQRTVLVRGDAGFAAVLHNGAWQQIPGPTRVGELAADPAGRVLWIGGIDGRGLELLTATPPAAVLTAFGCSHANVPARLSMHRPPRIGDMSRLELLGATPNGIALLAMSTPFVPVFLSGQCVTELVSPVLAAVLATDAYGNAFHALTVPVAPALLGMQVGTQAVVLEANGPLSGAFALSDALRLSVGD